MSFIALLKAVQADVPGCPGPYVYSAIAKTARDLCDKAGIWKYQSQTANMADGTSEITLTIPATADLVSVEYILFDSAELIQTSERELSSWDEDWRTAEGDPTHFYTKMPSDKVRLYPIPNRTVSSAFQYELTLKPKLTATSLDDWMCEQFGETIQAGAVYELLVMPGRPWSNPELAAHNRQRYRAGLYEARHKKLTDYASQNLNILPDPLV